MGYIGQRQLYDSVKSSIGDVTIETLRVSVEATVPSYPLLSGVNARIDHSSQSFSRSFRALRPSLLRYFPALRRLLVLFSFSFESSVNDTCVLNVRVDRSFERSGDCDYLSDFNSLNVIFASIVTRLISLAGYDGRAIRQSGRVTSGSQMFKDKRAQISPGRKVDILGVSPSGDSASIN